MRQLRQMGSPQSKQTALCSNTLTESLCSQLLIPQAYSKPLLFSAVVFALTLPLTFLPTADYAREVKQHDHTGRRDGPYEK